MAIRSPEDIIEIVNQKEQDTQLLRERMDFDYGLWRLDRYTGSEEDGLAGYMTYTTNEPRTFGRKMVGILGSAAMTIQVPVEANQEEGRSVRDDNSDKERFLAGNFKANDERLVLGDRPPLRDTMSWHLAIRGRTCGRSQLVKKNTGEVYADATPFDPRNVMYENGEDGLMWLCHKYYRLRSEVEDTLSTKNVSLLNETAGKSNDLVIVYDYYDRTHNTLIIPAVKEGFIHRRRHGMNRVPCWNVASTLQPVVMSVINEDAFGRQNSGSAFGPDLGTLSAAHFGASMADYGESIYAENRGQYETHNFMMSILKNLAARSLKPVFGIQSESGTKMVEGNPFEDGAEIPLGANEKLEGYDFLRSAPDLVTYETVVSGAMQRGGLPVIMFGETPAAISGFAMQNLKGGAADKVIPLVKALSMALRQICNNWSDHFNTGAFGQGMQMSGQDKNRKWFSSEITVEGIRDLPQAEITLVPELPEDQAGKIEMAARLSSPMADGMPTLSRRDILEDVLERQDPDADMDKVLEQMAAEFPLVKAHRMADALFKAGDIEGGQYWQAFWERQVQEFFQVGGNIDNLVPPGEGDNGDGSDGGGTGFSPQTLPQAAQGVPPPVPGIGTPFQAGPNVPPGMPRPGAQINGLSPL